MAYTPQRIQWPVDLSGIKCKSRSDLLRYTQAWNTFENVENYDDIVYQKISTGNRTTLFYQFKDRTELNYYRIGQQEHESRYPGVDFTPIRNYPFPNVPSTTPIPYVSPSPKVCGPFSTTQTSSERLANIIDLNTYVFVSTYNSDHVYKYIFKSDEEKMAYHRAERAILTSNT